MEEPYWSRYRPERRRFLRGIIAASAALSLAPVIAACRGGAATGGAGIAANGQSPARPVKGGTLTSSMSSDATNLDPALAFDVYSRVIIANCVEPLLTVDIQGQPAGLLATSW